MQTISLKSSGTEFTAYQIGQGEPVLLLHGFPDNPKSFFPLMEILSAKGYQCVAPILRGYEPQTITHPSRLHINELVEDALGWFDSLKWNKAHWIGHDWGGAIGYSLASYSPNRIKTLTALSIPLLKKLTTGLLWTPQQVIYSWYIVLFQVPFLAELAIKANDFSLINFLWRDWSPNFNPGESHLHEIKSMFANPGILASALSYYRNLGDLWSESGRETMFGILDQRLNVPTQTIYGKEDGCVHKKLYEKMSVAEDSPQGFRKIEMEGIGHFPHFENPKEVSEFCIDWMKRIP